MRWSRWAESAPKWVAAGLMPDVNPFVALQNVGNGNPVVVTGLGCPSHTNHCVITGMTQPMNNK